MVARGLVRPPSGYPCAYQAPFNPRLLCSPAFDTCSIGGTLRSLRFAGQKASCLCCSLAHEVRPLTATCLRSFGSLPPCPGGIVVARGLVRPPSGYPCAYQAPFNPRLLCSPAFDTCSIGGTLRSLRFAGQKASCLC